MSSASGKDQFMKQFDAIVEGVKQNKVKVSTIKVQSNHLRMTAIHTHMARRFPGMIWPTAVHRVLKYFYIFLWQVLYVIFSICGASNAVPVRCDVLSCSLGRVRCFCILEPSWYSIIYFHIFCIYIVFIFFNNLNNYTCKIYNIFITRQLTNLSWSWPTGICVHFCISCERG